MDCSTSGFPVHHQLPELTQTHVHRVSDAIQPSYLLSSPSPPAFNLSQHQRFFQWVSSADLVAKVLEFQKTPMGTQKHNPSKMQFGSIYALGKNMPVITASNTYFLNLKTFIPFNLIVCLWELTLNAQNAKMLYAHKCL